MDAVPAMVQTLLTQVPAPDLVVLYLAESQFPGKKLPASTTDLMAKEKKFEVRWVPKDTRAHKKLTPALIDFPDDIIITADDDVLYPADWLARLMTAHKKYPNAVIGHHVYRMRPDKPYRKWRKIQNHWRRRVLFGRPSFKNFATGCGGILYPPHALYKDVLKEELFMDLAPTADDVWFWAMAVLNGTKIAIVSNPIKHLEEQENTQDCALWADNAVDDRNNKFLAAIMERYPEIKRNYRG